MNKFRLNLIKAFSVVFAVCMGFAIITMPAKAQEVADFSVLQSASIRNGESDGLIGLKFSSSVNDTWLSENQADKYSFGTLLYPTKNEGSFDESKTATENMNLVDASNIIHVQNQSLSGGCTFSASIIYDRQSVIEALESKGATASDDLVDTVLRNLYNKDFTAKSYVVVNGETIYTNSYSTSMYKVAARTYALGVAENNETYKNLALNYFTSASVQTASVNFIDDVLAVENYTATEKTLVLRGNGVLVNGTDYTINQNGKIVFPADYTKLGAKETFLLVDDGVLTMVNATYGEDVQSVSQVLNATVGTEVVVKGYYVGVAEDANTSAETNQILLKDTENDKVIGFNTISNLPFADHTDFSTLTYNYGDLVVLKGTFNKNLNSYNKNKKFVTLSTANPLTSDKTVISTGNVVNYDFDNFLLIESEAELKQAFKTKTVVDDYTYVRLRMTVYLQRYKSKGYADKEYLTRLHYSASDTKLDATYMVALRQNAMTKNLGDAWKEQFDGSDFVERNVDIYALFSGSSSIYRQLTILEERWLKVCEHETYGEGVAYGDDKLVHTCSNCGYQLITHVHNYDGAEWITKTPATMFETGVKYRECVIDDNCKFVEYGVIEKVKQVSISVTKNPDKMLYLPGDKVEIEGMEVTVTGEDNSTAIVTDFTVEDKALSREDSTVTVSYNGLTTTLTLNMVPEHEHTYSGDYILDFAPTFFEVGSEYRVCTYEGCYEREEKVIDKVEITSIEITTAPSKTEYFIYENFDKTGMVVTGYGANDYSEVITEYVTVTANAIALGENQVTISYGEFIKTITVTGVVSNVSDVRYDIGLDSKVLVEGYFVGVADEGYNGDKEMLIKDVNTDDIIAVRGVSYDKFAKSFGYTYGDKVRFTATLKVDGTTYTVNKKYLLFSSENGDKASTIVSSGNQVNYSLENAVELDTYHDWEEVFTRDSSSYTYVHITGYVFSSRFTAKDSVDSIVISSEVSFTGSYGELKVNDGLIALRKSAMDINLGNGWADYFGKDYIKQNSSSDYTGPGYLKEVDIYAVFTGGVSSNFQLTILSNDWFKEVPVKATEELTTADIIREVAFSYYRQNTQIQYNQTVSRRNINAKPEDATAQHLTYLDCSSFVGAVIKESLGIEIIPDEVLGTDDDKYPITTTVPQTGRFATYAKNYAGNPDYPDIIKFITKSQMDTEDERLAVTKDLEQNLQPGDVINYRKAGNGSGHVILYIGDGLFIHCHGSDYNEGKTAPSTARDGAVGFEALDGAIGFLTLYDVISNAEHDRYIVSNKKSDSISWFRPINRADAQVTDTALTRVQYRGLDAEKTLDAGVNTSVQKGQVLTYTVTVKNHFNTDYQGVEFKEILDPNVTLVEAPNGYALNGNELTFTVDVPHHEFTTFTYKVKVNDNATGIIESANSTFAGVRLAKIVNSVSNYTLEQLNKVVTKAKEYSSNGTSFENDMDLVSSLYNELGITAFDKYTTIESLLDELMDTTGAVLNDVEIASYVAPNLYGGRDMANNYIRNKEIIRLMEEYNLSIGDIILAEFDLYNGTGSSAVKTGNVVHVIYVYVGNSQLVCLTDDTTHAAFTNGTASEGAEVNKCFTITMLTENARRDTHVLSSVFTYDRWVVLRP